ncbi:MAG: molybdopterin molybdotransferase MoeA [Ekhidna sp.]
MVSIEDALKLIDQQDINLVSDELPLAQSLDCHLAKEVTAPFDLPSFDNSAMDGYAVCGQSTTFEIVGEVAAGNTDSFELSEGQAMRIFTGGRVPENTTAVIMQEKTSIEGNSLKLDEEVVPGKNVRRKGAEISEGQLVFEKGHKITPATMGVLSSLGIANVSVFQQPVIHVMATGNELIEPGKEKKDGQIYESNSQTLDGALQHQGFYCGERKTIHDDLDAISDAIADDLKRCDVLLITGGISVGDYDYVKQALEENEVEEIFYKVKQKPGKPLYFGRRDDQFVFALPGNPASSLTCFYIYVLPLLQRLSGGAGKGLLRVNVPLKESFHFKSDRPTFLKAIIEESEVTILDGQGSSMIHSMARSNALAFMDEIGEKAKGEMVECLLI